MSTLKLVGSTGNKTFKNLSNMSIEVGTTLTNFNIPPLLNLMALNRRGAEYHCYCDGELVSNVANVTARGLGMFINNCKSLNLTLQNKIHRITYILPYGDEHEIKYGMYIRLKYGMYIRYIIPTVNGEPIVSNNLRSELGVYQNGYYLMNLSNVEKDFISRMDGIVVQWGKEQGVMIDGE